MRDALHHLLGAEVDLVMAGAVRNPIIAREIAATCQQIYGMLSGSHLLPFDDQCWVT